MPGFQARASHECSDGASVSFLVDFECQRAGLVLHTFKGFYLRRVCVPDFAAVFEQRSYISEPDQQFRLDRNSVVDQQLRQFRRSVLSFPYHVFDVVAPVQVPGEVDSEILVFFDHFQLCASAVPDSSFRCFAWFFIGYHDLAFL